VKTAIVTLLAAGLLLSGRALPAEPQLDVPVDARDAVAIVDHFFAALSAGDLDRAGAMLDPRVVILESGGAEHSAQEYLGGHAKGDAAFLGQAHQRLQRRTARIDGDLAWVASESELHTQREGKPAVTLSTETMVLQSTRAGWMIVHIHWSSRVRKTDGAGH